METQSRSQWMFALKWIIYLSSLFVVFILQSVPDFLSIGGVRPILLAGIAIGVAFFESELPACVFAFLAGFLFDCSSHRIMGSNALIFLLFALALSLITHYLSLPHFWSYLLWSGAALFLGFHLLFLFEHALVWPEGIERYYFSHFLPQLGLSFLTTLPWYPIIKKVHTIAPLSEV